MASFSDEAVYLHENVVRGQHVYKRVWSPDISEVLQFLWEDDNDTTVLLYHIAARDLQI